MLRGKAEIRGFLTVSKDDIQESSNSKKSRDLPKGSSGENSSQQRGKQIIKKPAENAACSVPECLPCQFFNAAQKDWIFVSKSN
jgi:hypothetical protein